MLTLLGDPPVDDAAAIEEDAAGFENEARTLAWLWT
jgi:hypothetical protein